MKKILRALVMDDGSQLAHKLRELIYPAFEIGAYQIVYTAHEALEALINEEYNICLLPDFTTREESDNLMSDYRKLEKELECDFIEVREFLPDDFDRSSLRKQGFASVISHAITADDIHAIEETLKHQVRAEKIIDKANGVKESLGLLLRDLDRTAADRKRGRETPLRSISSQFISTETAFDEKVLKKYFNALSDQSAAQEAPQADSISVPDNILKKGAPGLSRDRYTGASQRVWKKLIRLYGKVSRLAPQEDIKEEQALSEQVPEQDEKDKSP